MTSSGGYGTDSRCSGSSYFLSELDVGCASIRNNTYIIVDKATKQAAVVDPAWEPDAIVDLLSEYDARLTAILVTHSHFDHVNLVKPLLGLFRPTVYMSGREIAYYQYHCERLRPMHHLDEIRLGETLITCLLTPGHTAGSASFLLSDTLFTGDTIFIEGCGICSTYGGSAEEMYESIQMVKAVVSPHVRICPGHSYGKRPGYPLSHLMEENIYFQIDQKDHFVRFRMRMGQKHMDVTSARSLPPDYGMERGNK